MFTCILYSRGYITNNYTCKEGWRQADGWS